MSIDTVKFRGRHVPKAALAALIIGALTIIILITLSILASVHDDVTEVEGIIATVAMIVSFTGLVRSVISSQERDIYTAIPIAGMIVNGISLIFYLIVFVLGIV